MPFTDWKCPKCRREIRVDNSLESCYCNACGEKIPVASSMTANHATSAKGLIDWVCPKCGQEIRINASLQSCHCNACGEKISVAPKSKGKVSGKAASESKAGTASDRSTKKPVEAEKYRKAIAMMERASTVREYRTAAKLFYEIVSYGDSQHMLNICLKRARGIESDQQEGVTARKVQGWKSATATGTTDDKHAQKQESAQLASGWKSGTSSSQSTSKQTSEGSSGQSTKKSGGNTSKIPASQSKTPFLDNWKTSVGMFILGLICSYGFGSLGVFGTPVLLGVAVTFAIGLLYWTLSGYPSLFTSNPHLRSLGAVSFFNAFFGGIIFGALWNTCLTKGKKGVSQNVFLALIVAMCVFVVAFMFPNLSGLKLPDFNNGSAKSSAAQPANNTNNNAKSSTSTPAKPNATTTRSYEDKRWPTFNKDTLAIPESERWYNATDSLGTWCRITGPVNRVYEGQDTSGNQVTIIEIGTSSYGYGPKPVSLIIWPWDTGNLGNVIDGCRKKSTWLTVEGSLYEDNGRYVFASSNGVTCTYWTNTNWP